MSRIDRRRFTALSALTLAATRLRAQTTAQPPQQSPTGMPTLAKPVGYCPVGLGDISDIFIRACAETPNARVTGLVSGHAEQKAPKYQQEFNIPNSSVYTYETYDHIRDNPAIDAVYIGLPNSMHAEYTIRAAEAGKHVLCEKPMAISSAECRKMIDACRAHNVKLMIAYRVHYDPTWQHIRDLARNGAIGEIQGFQGGFYGNKREGEWRLDRKLAGGGSLMDLGIYPLNAIRWIAGEEPATYAAQVSTKIKGRRFASVEETVEFNFKFPSGTLASSGSSYGEAGPAYINICGTEGYHPGAARVLLQRPEVHRARQRTGRSPAPTTPRGRTSSSMRPTTSPGAFATTRSRSRLVRKAWRTCSRSRLSTALQALRSRRAVARRATTGLTFCIDTTSSAERVCSRWLLARRLAESYNLI